MHTFFIPDLGPAIVELPEEEAGHALRVLRLADGARITLVDGRGTRALADLSISGKRGAMAHIVSREHVPDARRSGIHLAVAPTKAIDRFEWLLEKATEIGVDRITPLITARTERGRLRRDRSEKILISAMKQSRRAWLPTLDAATTWEHFIGADLPPQRLFGWCEGTPVDLARAYDPSREAVIVIGPEGDFTHEEAGELRSRGFTAVGLGTARLRTETAAIAAIAWMNFAQRT